MTAALPTDGLDDSPEPDDATRSQIRGSSLLLAGQVFAVGVNLAIQILIVRYLAKSSFGAFAYVLSVVGIAQSFAAFGLRHAVSRFMPLYEERGDQARAAGTFVLACSIVLSLGLGIAIGVIAMREVIAGGIDGEAVALITIMIALAPLFALGTVLDGAMAVFARPRAILLRRFVLVPLLRLAVVGLLVLTESGVLVLAWGYLAVELIGLCAYLPMLVPAFRGRDLLGHLRPRRMQLPVREVFGFTLPLFSSDIAAAVLNFAGAIVVGALAGALEVASLRAVFPVVLTMGYVLSSFGMLFVPLVSRLHARGEAEELGRLYWHTATWTTLLAYPILATSVILAEPLTELLFGARYESSAPILAVLAVGLFINTAAGHNGVTLGVFGRVRIVATASLAAIVVDLALTFLLVPDHGALGAAIAIAVAYAVMNGLRQVALVRHTSVGAVEPVYATVLATAFLATAAATAIQLALSPPWPVGIGLTALACAVVFASVRGRLRLLDTFPELARLPLLGRRLKRG